MTTEDFPTIPTIEDGKVCKINTKELQNGIKSVIYSASTSSVKPELASVYVYSNEENLIFVSTDSFRLAEKIIKTKKKVDLSGVLIPAKNAADLLKIVEGIEEDVELNSQKTKYHFLYQECILFPV
jgi:DNA polymerase-3 subunit beta